ncbi:MAG: hypothetical protein LBF84_01290 [Holosporales bacterium]|jgi:hypothetical protein|nr:hypothetical protein [Holosporales bacterium]
MKSLFFRAALSIGCAFLPISSAVATNAGVEALWPSSFRNLSDEQKGILTTAADLCNEITEKLDERVDAEGAKMRTAVDKLTASLNQFSEEVKMSALGCVHIFPYTFSAPNGKCGVVECHEWQKDGRLGCITFSADIQVNACTAWHQSRDIDWHRIKQFFYIEPVDPQFPQIESLRKALILIEHQIARCSAVREFFEDPQLDERIKACTKRLDSLKRDIATAIDAARNAGNL